MCFATRLISGVQVHCTGKPDEWVIAAVITLEPNGSFPAVARVLIHREPQQFSRLLQVHAHNANVTLRFVRASAWTSWLELPTGTKFLVERPRAFEWICAVIRSRSLSTCRLTDLHLDVSSYLVKVSHLSAVMDVARKSHSVAKYSLNNTWDGYLTSDIAGLLQDPFIVASKSARIYFVS